MQQKISLKVLPEEAYSDASLKKIISTAAAVAENAITGWHVTKRSIDARGKIVWINITVNAFINEPFYNRDRTQFRFCDVSNSTKKIIIIGAGPAGLFAALYCLENGIKPILLERGKDVRERRRDLAILNKEGIINENSNYCFGEGGAGTYSDGKLYTRSNKRGDLDRILNMFVHFGAEENILFDAHPHIGTNKLPQIIAAMRATILSCGGEIFFNKRVVDFDLRNKSITSILTEDGQSFEGDHYILATGHSAGEVYELLHSKQLKILPKPFALGVRLEHPQDIIDQLQYYGGSRNILPPASYSLVQQIDNKGVFSFCMCPGGIIAPASSHQGELVVNGWSPSKRNNPFANSGIVVQVEPKDVLMYHQKTAGSINENDPLLLYRFQKEIEKNAYNAGGGNFVAPAQRMMDFMEKKVSTTLPDCSYIPGIKSVELRNVLPEFISERIAKAFKSFGQKMPSRTGGKGFLTNEAIVVGVESRTSSSVRIPRNDITLVHPQINNLSPCGEGGGFAGGIVSAAMDGEKVVSAILQHSLM